MVVDVGNKSTFVGRGRGRGVLGLLKINNMKIKISKLQQDQPKQPPNSPKLVEVQEPIKKKTKDSHQLPRKGKRPLEEENQGKIREVSSKYKWVAPEWTSIYPESVWSSYNQIYVSTKPMTLMDANGDIKEITKDPESIKEMTGQDSGIENDDRNSKTPDDKRSEDGGMGERSHPNNEINQIKDTPDALAVTGIECQHSSEYEHDNDDDSHDDGTWTEDDSFSSSDLSDFNSRPERLREEEEDAQYSTESENEQENQRKKKSPDQTNNKVEEMKDSQGRQNNRLYQENVDANAKSYLSPERPHVNTTTNLRDLPYFQESKTKRSSSRRMNKNDTNQLYNYKTKRFDFVDDKGKKLAKLSPAETNLVDKAHSTAPKTQGVKIKKKICDYKEAFPELPKSTALKSINNNNSAKRKNCRSKFSNNSKNNFSYNKIASKAACNPTQTAKVNEKNDGSSFEEVAAKLQGHKFPEVIKYTVDNAPVSNGNLRNENSKQNTMKGSRVDTTSPTRSNQVKRHPNGTSKHDEVRPAFEDENKAFHSVQFKQHKGVEKFKSVVEDCELTIEESRSKEYDITEENLKSCLQYCFDEEKHEKNKQNIATFMDNEKQQQVNLKKEITNEGKGTARDMRVQKHWGDKYCHDSLGHQVQTFNTSLTFISDILDERYMLFINHWTPKKDEMTFWKQWNKFDEIDFTFPILNSAKKLSSLACKPCCQPHRNCYLADMGPDLIL